MDNESLKFIQLCEEKNKILSEITDKEVVSDETAFKSMVIVRNLKVEGVGDALIYAAALNCLNTYVKQSPQAKAAVGYSFKKSVDILIKYVLKNPDGLVKAEIQKDRDMPVCYIQFDSLQFSFHNVEQTLENRAIAAKPGCETIHWDGIRKQMCAVTAFEFAMSCTYDRGNHMMDGSDFESGLNRLTEEFNTGKKSIEDVKRAVFIGNASASGAVKVSTDLVSNFPLRNNVVATLYEGDVGSFLKEMYCRRLVPYIVERYEEGYGLSVAAFTQVSWKYEMECFTSMLKKADLRDDTGIRVDCFRSSSQEILEILLVSLDEEGYYHFTSVGLLAWEKMKMEEGGMVKYCEADHTLEVKSYHPSVMSAQYSEIVSRGLNLRVNIGCTYMYNVALSPDNDIVSRLDSRLQDNNPVFYADQADDLSSLLHNALIDGNGRPVLENLRRIEREYSVISDSRISNECRYITDLTEDAINAKIRGFLILNYRKSSGNLDYLEYITGEFDKDGYKYAVCRSDEDVKRLSGNETIALYYDYIPENVDPSVIPSHLLLIDMLALNSEESGAVTDLVERVVQAGYTASRYDFNVASGYKDYGAGNNWLIRNLTLGNVDSQFWSPLKYSIEVVDSEQEFSEEDGIANVIIPETFRYDSVSGCIEAGEEERINVYRLLSEGANGVRLCIRDSELKKHISEEISSVKTEAEWMKSYIDAQSGDIEKFIESSRESLSSTTAYNIFKRLAVDNIGQDAWDKMKKDSQDWIVSALVSFAEMKNTDPLMDFSGVTLMISKIFENELSLRWGSGYMDYLMRKYGDSYIDELPETLVSINSYGEKKPVASSRLTLGDIPFIMGLDSKGIIRNEDEFEKFKAYSRDELLISTDELEDVIQEIVDIVYYVRCNYRNKSAHKDFVDLIVAADCIDYCITSKYKLRHLMNLLKK